MGFLKKNWAPLTGQTLMALVVAGAVFTGWSGDRTASAVLLGIALLVLGANLWIAVHYHVSVEQQSRSEAKAQLPAGVGTVTYLRASLEDEAQYRALEVWTQAAVARLGCGGEPDATEVAADAIAVADAVALAYERRLFEVSLRMRNAAMASLPQPPKDTAEAKASEGSS